MKGFVFGELIKFIICAAASIALIYAFIKGKI